MPDKEKKGKKDKKNPVHKVGFELEAPDAGSVYLAGSFNDWDAQAHPMKKGKKGTWKVKLSLRPGLYEYRFVVDGEWTTDHSCGVSVANGFGGRNSIRVVE